MNSNQTKTQSKPELSNDDDLTNRIVPALFEQISLFETNDGLFVKPKFTASLSQKPTIQGEIKG